MAAKGRLSEHVYQTILPNTPNMYQDKGIHQMTEGHRFKEQSSVIINSFFSGQLSLWPRCT